MCYSQLLCATAVECWGCVKVYRSGIWCPLNYYYYYCYGTRNLCELINRDVIPMEFPLKIQPKELLIYPEIISHDYVLYNCLVFLFVAKKQSNEFLVNVL